MSINMYICINAITVSVANNSPNIYTLKSPLGGSWQSPMQPETVWLSMREVRRRCGSVGVAAVVEWGRGTSEKTPWGRATCPPVAIHCAGGLEQPTKKSRTATINKRTLVIILLFTHDHTSDIFEHWPEGWRQWSSPDDWNFSSALIWKS